MARPFLTAAWRDLLLLNYGVEHAVLAPYLPSGVDLDLFAGTCFVSLVGFRFLDTRVRGFAIPFHRDFDEINLRFYVTRAMPDGSARRGVVFIRELVPRRAIAAVARSRYGEPYLAVPMRHEVEPDGPGKVVSYSFRTSSAWHTLSGRPEGPRILATDDAATAFITEHYWGYTRRGPSQTSEYEVRHPVWQVRRVAGARFAGDGTAVYGKRLAEILAEPPASAFLADGSAIEVHPRDG